MAARSQGVCFDASNRQADESPFVGIGVENCMSSSGQRGAYIVHLYSGSPAAASALKVGDRIVRFGGCPVANRSDLARAIANYSVRAPVDIQFERDGGREYIAKLVTAVAHVRSTAVGLAKRDDDAQESACRSIGMRRWFVDPAEAGVRPSAPGAGPADEMQVHNACHRSVRLAVGLPGRGPEWAAVGWWTLEAGQQAYLTHQGARVTVADPLIQFFAETLPEGATWDGAKLVTVFSRSVGMREIRLGADRLLRLQCDALPR